MNDKHIGLSLTYEYFWIQSTLINTAIADDFSHKDDTLAQLNLMQEVFKKIISPLENSKDSLNGIFPIQDLNKNLIGYAYAAFFLSNINEMKEIYQNKDPKRFFETKLLNVDPFEESTNHLAAKMNWINYVSEQAEEGTFETIEVESKDLKDFLWRSYFGNLTTLTRNYKTFKRNSSTYDVLPHKEFEKAKRKIRKGKKYFSDEKQQKRRGLFNSTNTNSRVEKTEELARQNISFNQDKSALQITISRN